MLLAAGWQSLLDGDLGGTCPCPSHQHCVPQRTSVTGAEMCHSSCWRCSLSDTMKGISRRHLSEDAWGTSCQSLLPPQSHGVPVTMQEFARTIPRAFSFRLFMNSLYSKITCASWLFRTLNIFFPIEIVIIRLTSKPTKYHNISEV